MTRRNRVLPTGEIVALPFRGDLMGNRGALHDADQQVVRPWKLRAWLICRLEFNGRHRTLMAPGRYTELFFLDEVHALAAGHRPCSECRRAQFRSFLEAAGRPDADALDRTLARERLSGRPRQRRETRRQKHHRERVNAVPEGSMILVGRTVFARSPRGFIAWRRDAPEGYLASLEDGAGRDAKTLWAMLASDAQALVITPPISRRAIEGGYVPHWHASAKKAEAVSA